VPLTFYEVDDDPNRFQYFLLEDASAADHYHFDGRPLSQVWRPPAVYSYQPRLPEGDFWSFGLGAFGSVFAVRPEALDRPGVRQYLMNVGELLPLPYDGTERRQLFRNLVDDEQLTGIVFRELHSVE
jgi:hypothetical protein